MFTDYKVSYTNILLTQYLHKSKLGVFTDYIVSYTNILLTQYLHKSKLGVFKDDIVSLELGNGPVHQTVYLTV